MSVWLLRQQLPLSLRNSRTFALHKGTLVYYIHHHAPSSLSRPARHDLLRGLPLSSTTRRWQSTNAKDISDEKRVSSEVKSGAIAKDEPKPPLATRVWKKVKHEAAHYWSGTKLLVSEVRISARLQWKILQGETLTRRERRQVRGTVVVGWSGH